jgi:hypothetical protein
MVGAQQTKMWGAGDVNVNVFSLGLSNATEEQQVYSAERMWRWGHVRVQGQVRWDEPRCTHGWKGECQCIFIGEKDPPLLDGRSTPPGRPR